MRVLISACVGVALAAAIGCESADPELERFEIALAATDHPRDVGAELLFDPRPGRYSASDFACRSDWPSTESFYRPAEQIYYQERFIDYQGPGFHTPDRVYRRFETYRSGVGYR